MAERLRLDAVELEGFMKLLDGSVTSLKGLRSALAGATVGGLGTDELDKACEDFQEDWKYGAEQIGEQAEDLSKIIEQSKDAFLEVEDALVKALHKAGKTNDDIVEVPK
ncbi:hypothetical protein [Streptomyces sp. BA2]|uniref:hypothetical protein n=1 Tax=Streptomyces sp. BA2 TaxID=436595 RepID=UPI00132B3FAA|nr:hypothetical protein [Streptomyces sp. BA2]MWA12095.1 hypothetical protein [Streptomyces sp. BA2]